MESNAQPLRASKRKSVYDEERPHKRNRRQMAAEFESLNPQPPLNSRNPVPPSDIASNQHAIPNTRKRGHTKKDRKNNRSSKIHSLRNQLARGSLPQLIHREKERELAALLMDQEKDKVKQQGKKNLQRYHFVRFLERQKAEKKLRQLRKQQSKADDTKNLEEQIHEMEVSLNYAIYAPLGEKYISIFAKDSRQEKHNDRDHNPSQMREQDWAILSEAQRNELRESTRDASEVLNTTDSAMDGSGQKPPMWYEVESAMAKGQSHLEALRDGKHFQNQSSNSDHLVERGQKPGRERLEKNSGTELKRREIQEAGLEDEKSNSDEDMSDGGFFER